MNPQDFREMVSEGKPRILKNFFDPETPAANWDLNSLWYKMKNDPINVIRQPVPSVMWDPGTGLASQKEPFGNAAYDILHSREYIYAQDDINALPRIRHDVPVIPGIVRTKFWMSNRDIVTPLHYDPVETLHWVIQGKKEFVLGKPGIRGYDPYPANSKASFIGRADYLAACDELHSIKAGDVLYLPAYWWHRVASEARVNISLNFVWMPKWTRNLRNFNQWNRTRKHVKRQLAAVNALKDPKWIT